MSTDCLLPGLHLRNDTSCVPVARYGPTVQQGLQRKPGLFYPSTPLPAAPWGGLEMSHPSNGLRHPCLTLTIWQVYCGRRHGRGELTFLWVGRCTFLLTSANPCRIIFFNWQNSFFLTESNTILSSSSVMISASVNTGRSLMDYSDVLVYVHICLCP